MTGLQRNESALERKNRSIEKQREITEAIINHRHAGNTVSDTCKFLNISRLTYFTYIRACGYNDIGVDGKSLYTRYVKNKGQQVHFKREQPQYIIEDDAYRKETTKAIKTKMKKVLSNIDDTSSNVRNSKKTARSNTK
jgi:hypothetical protein